MCKVCRKRTKVTKHHIIPKFFGGALEKGNVLLCCRDCHDLIHWTRPLNQLHHEMRDAIFEGNLERIRRVRRYMDRCGDIETLVTLAYYRHVIAELWKNT